MTTRFRLARAYLRSAGRSLRNAAHILCFGPQPPSTEPYPLPASAHPSAACACPCGPTGRYADHASGCAWRKVMCRACDGHGHCATCLGDGTRPEGALWGALLWQPTHITVAANENDTAREIEVRLRLRVILANEDAAAVMTQLRALPETARFTLTRIAP